MATAHRFTIKKGLDLPIDGAPAPVVENGAEIRTVALIGRDYVGMKPTMFVSEGDRVAFGQPLFEDKKTPGVIYTAPAGGEITAINRGARRMLQSVVIRIDAELDGKPHETFEPVADVASMGREAVQDRLIRSGLWTALRTRPLSKVPAPGSAPRSIFVTAIDTNPLAASPEQVIAEQPDRFRAGLRVLETLTDGKLYLCQAPDAELPTTDSSRLVTAGFDGCHPAGLVGTHIHMLEPVGMGNCVWHIGYQDVMALGALFAEGRLDPSRVVALGGPNVRRPRLLRTRMGASTDDLLDGEITGDDARAISGSVLSGRRAAGWASYLGRYHTQISVLPEGREREFMGWVMPGRNRFSKINVFISSILKPVSYRFNTSQNGSPRAMVPIGNYEEVMPLDILPTQLLRSLLVRDTDTAQALGCMELDEEDLALASFVDVAKYDFGPHLRASLEQIERDG
ncbi:Na(+)-translocating NADH-quinone reductase subunit A [Salinisphaera sp. P385]|uniref:Na(+)-translocating NADH-quinone reductase subunit A n=1 Tax=Spectribacter acetivorans TaxID=3075603 RepID=A0ABU3B5Y3_9GAMM|nr:Na(+)-translocating NADH-quinone reductase subunit A [Salinisphaera sp. P385]MDT0617859.1 Na(+)-translocating NADH-quinone reductase subunit A [Salinisphaera sp. P385]